VVQEADHAEMAISVKVDQHVIVMTDLAKTNHVKIESHAAIVLSVTASREIINQGITSQDVTVGTQGHAAM